MKTNFLIVAIFAVFCGGCMTAEYLPPSENIDINQYGSYISVSKTDGQSVSGELLAVDSTKLVVLKTTKSDSTQKAVIVPRAEIKGFSLRYASSVHYGGTIPATFLLILWHGWLSVITFPLNLIGTTAVTISSEGSFKYNEKTLSYEKMQMFARFPQGIPPRFDLDNVKQGAPIIR